MVERNMLTKWHAERYFDDALERTSPFVLVSMFTAVILNILGSLSRELCNMTLDMLELIIRATVARELSVTEERILRKFPKDVQTISHLPECRASNSALRRVPSLLIYP